MGQKKKSYFIKKKEVILKKNNRSTFTRVIMNCSILKTAKVTLFLIVVASLNACTKQIKLEIITSSAELRSTPALTLKGPITSERTDWKKKKHPHWIFSDDFETTDPFVGDGRYFEYDDNGGDFISMDGVGVNGSHGMRVKWQSGEVAGGGPTTFGLSGTKKEIKCT
ncbi:MAG: hypothetical protein ABI760_23995 [Ferruginibacter sp.]